MVRALGLEPRRLSALAFETSAATVSPSPVISKLVREVGLEPTRLSAQSSRPCVATITPLADIGAGPRIRTETSQGHCLLRTARLPFRQSRNWWEGVDSNHSRRPGSDLQSDCRIRTTLPALELDLLVDGNENEKSARSPEASDAFENLAEGGGVEPLSFRIARLSKPVAHQRAPPSA